MDDESFFIVKKRALSEVLLKVVEAKRLLASEETMTVQEATERVELSRSSFYKYKDDISPTNRDFYPRCLAHSQKQRQIS